MKDDAVSTNNPSRRITRQQNRMLEAFQQKLGANHLLTLYPKDTSSLHKDLSINTADHLIAGHQDHKTEWPESDQAENDEAKQN